MERKEQTGHICRWMALGIMTAIVIVGCTIVIGLFEWRDRKEIDCKNAELHQWRKNVHDLNLHITELSLLGEMIADWDSTDVNEYHSLRLEVDSMLQGIVGICPKEDSDTICHLLAEKEQLLLDIKDAMQDLNATQEKLTAEVPRIVEQNKTESKRLSAMPQQAKPKKRGFFSRLFGKKENAVTTGNRLTQTEKMLTNLNQTVVAKHHQQSRKVVEILDSLGNRNESINKQLQRVISIADENVDKGIKVRERQIADLEGNYTYYYIGMIGLLILVFFVLFLLVWRFAFKTRKSKEETRKVMLTVTHEMRSPLSAIKDYARKISGLDDATDESKRYADLIVDTSKGLTSMIDSFLVYSKLANGKATVKERPFRMMDIAEQLKMEYEPFAAKKQLELSVNNKADGVVNGDKEKVLTIGRNLLSNAIKYTGKGEIVLSTTYKNGVFMLMVKDTGFHLSMPHIKDCLGTVGLYVRKAIAFVRRMQEHVAATYHLHVTTSTSEASPPVSLESKPLVKWTGNAVDLVEMVYGICVMGSVNDGDVKFKDLAQAMYQFFGIKAKDCYRFYTDIRRRKNYSRTYFLDKMQEKLNEKMRRDDELERMRR